MIGNERLFAEVGSKGKMQRQVPLPLHIQAAVSFCWGANRLGVTGGGGRKESFVKGDAGMKKGRVGKGYGPDDSAGSLNCGGSLADLQEKAERGVRGQHLAGGKADAVFAEVNGPGVIFPHTGSLITADDFGKAENMVVGDPSGAAAVERWDMVLSSLLVLSGQHDIVAARSVLIGLAIGGYMLLYR